MGLSLSRSCPCLAASAGHEPAETAPGRAGLLLPALLHQGTGRKGWWTLLWSSLPLPEILHQPQRNLYYVHSVDPALPPSLKINSAEPKLPWGAALGQIEERNLQGAAAPLEQQVGYPSPKLCPSTQISQALVSQSMCCSGRMGLECCARLSAESVTLTAAWGSSSCLLFPSHPHAKGMLKPGMSQPCAVTAQTPVLG